ncbi:MAG: Vi polysaccharide biosynthesis UDP-N-acetylglucosamine C-6 dehydrogenase TviB [Candidatus Marinimicrobia bacterium]|nr:Vi polysaccharide biosynthesis UDP-N-acetylglucosamine C-6 dehydrogenase TviB [Candidatus Neomarinimicrobiota bacterium]
MNKLSSNSKIAVIGLGYVGLPLAVEFSKKYNVIGFDINAMRIQELQSGIDRTLELETSELKKASNLKYTSDLIEISECTIFIIGVPTPVNENKEPDFTNLISASKNIGKVLKKNDIVIFESTVYPGATEEICVPELAKNSNLTFNKDFYVGYSPERINPGDKSHRLTDIIKVTSGSTPEAASLVDDLYSSIITAGTYKASSIKVAEAAKVIENTQRDVNIGLINELAIIFNKLSIDTEEVLKAAGTKWNFLPFNPGLVGGHCIGVDPYYLSYKSQSIGYEPEIILAGRRINDGMSKYVALELVKNMTKKNILIQESSVLIMGITFKEDCPDTRNTKVLNLIDELSDLGANVDTYDPWVSKDDLLENYQSGHIDDLTNKKYDAVVFAVAHQKFKKMKPENIKALCKPNHIIYDLKYLFSSDVTDLRL